MAILQVSLESDGVALIEDQKRPFEKPICSPDYPGLQALQALAQAPGPGETGWATVAAGHVVDVAPGAVLEERIAQKVGRPFCTPESLVEMAQSVPIVLMSKKAYTAVRIAQDIPVAEAVSSGGINYTPANDHGIPHPVAQKMALARDINMNLSHEIRT
jgi:hypothetical protein